MKMNAGFSFLLGLLIMFSFTLCNRRRKLSRRVARPDPPLKPFTNTSTVYISYTQFLKSFSSTQGIFNKTASFPSNETYTSFMETVAQDINIKNKDDLSSFMAHAFVISNGLTHKRDDDTSVLDDFSRTYFDRGYLGISGVYAYRNASMELFGDYRLLEAPEQVVQNESVNWKVSLWSWKQALTEAASGKIEKICGYFTYTKCPEIEKVYSIIKKELLLASKNSTNSIAIQ